ncbi:hypothetical protein F6450_00190, partial [Photobacterium damselae subsp. damselae]
EWRVASGEWRVASGEWRVASGEWRVASGEILGYIHFMSINSFYPLTFTCYENLKTKILITRHKIIILAHLP